MRAPARILILIALAAASPARAQDAPQAGSYEVRYRLELPHVEGGAEETATVCLSEPGVSKGFAVLSANNPLGHCPVGEVRREGGAVTFDIVCPGGNAAKASARFDVTPNGFQGRIAMNMGGKNMTMTEVQRARRVGECAPGASVTQ